MTTNPMPKAKTERLIVREIDGETLVYDRSRDAASCLNEFAARVWRECDGETSVAEIAAALGEDERAVWLALHQLTKAQLLTEAIAFPPDMSAAKSRREVGGRLGLGAAAFVASIVAPMPAQAASCGMFFRALHGGAGNWHVLCWTLARVRPAGGLQVLNGQLLRMAGAATGGAGEEASARLAGGARAGGFGVTFMAQPVWGGTNAGG